MKTRQNSVNNLSNFLRSCLVLKATFKENAENPKNRVGDFISYQMSFMKSKNVWVLLVIMGCCVFNLSAQDLKETESEVYAKSSTGDLGSDTPNTEYQSKIPGYSNRKRLWEITADSTKSGASGSAFDGKGSTFLSGGVGIGSALYGGVPIFGNLEYGLTDNLSLGLDVAYLSYEEEYIYSSATWTVITVGPRLSYYYTEMLGIEDPRLALYAGVFVGYAAASYESDFIDIEAADPLAYNVYAGLRYMFNEKFAGTAELGYGLATLRLGLAVKLSK